MDREAVMRALVTVMSNVSGVATIGRRVVHWSKCAEQPALFLRNVRDAYQQRDHLPPRRVMHVEVWVYAKTDIQDSSNGPGAVLNGIIDDIEAALVPNVLTNRVDLGGLVHHVWIEGEIEYDPGDLDDQAKAIIPIHILVP